jgi:hypothetical protein
MTYSFCVCVEIIVLNNVLWCICDKCRLCYQACMLKASSAYRYGEQIQLVQCKMAFFIILFLTPAITIVNIYILRTA